MLPFLTASFFIQKLLTLIFICTRLYKKYCSQYNPGALQSWLQQEDDWSALAHQSLIESYSTGRIETRLSALVGFFLGFSVNCHMLHGLLSIWSLYDHFLLHAQSRYNLGFPTANGNLPFTVVIDTFLPPFFDRKSRDKPDSKIAVNDNYRSNGKTYGKKHTYV